MGLRVCPSQASSRDQRSRSGQDLARRRSFTARVLTAPTVRPKSAATSGQVPDGLLVEPVDRRQPGRRPAFAPEPPEFLEHGGCERALALGCGSGRVVVDRLSPSTGGDLPLEGGWRRLFLDLGWFLVLSGEQEVGPLALPIDAPTPSLAPKKVRETSRPRSQKSTWSHALERYRKNVAREILTSSMTRSRRNPQR